MESSSGAAPPLSGIESEFSPASALRRSQDGLALTRLLIDCTNHTGGNYRMIGRCGASAHADLPKRAARHEKASAQRFHPAGDGRAPARQQDAALRPVFIDELWFCLNSLGFFKLSAKPQQQLHIQALCCAVSTCSLKAQKQT